MIKRIAVLEREIEAARNVRINYQRERDETAEKLRQAETSSTKWQQKYI